MPDRGVSRWLPAVGVVSLLLVAGCASSIDTTSTASPSPTASPSEPPCARDVSLFGPDGPERTTWEPDTVAIAFYLEATASVLFVVHENDTVIGVEHTTVGNPVFADGFEIGLERALEGEHTIRVTAYSDANGNEQYDPSIDAPCRHRGEVAQAGPRTVNFSAVTTEESS